MLRVTNRLFEHYDDFVNDIQKKASLITVKEIDESLYGALKSLEDANEIMGTDMWHLIFALSWGIVSIDETGQKEYISPNNLHISHKLYKGHSTFVLLQIEDNNQTDTIFNYVPKMWALKDFGETWTTNDNLEELLNEWYGR